MELNTKAFKKPDFYTGLGIFAVFIWFIQNTTGIWRFLFLIAAISDGYFILKRVIK